MRIIYLAVFLVIVFFSNCRKKSSVPEPPGPGTLRVSGYLYSENFWNTHLTTDLNLLTDLNLAFINPDAEGDFQLNEEVSLVIARAHAKKVRVYLSLGGAAAPIHFRDLLKDDRRAGLVDKIVAVAEQFDFDGVDVDLEGDMIDENYANFIYELWVQLQQKNILLTAAVATWNGNVMHDTTLARFDYVNVMAYDKTGPWDPGNAGPHSSYEAASNDAMYYITTRGIDASKILIGVPFYGYRFNNGTATGMSYKEIVSQHAGAENTDVADIAGGGKVYYNGIPTIKRKVALAHELGAAGIMIWEINQDTNDDLSLLKAINKKR